VSIVKYFGEKLGLCNRAEFDVNMLRAQLTIDEGCPDKIYLDHLGNATLGIGHLITIADLEYRFSVGTLVSPARIEEAFAGDIEWTLDDCGLCFPSWDYYPAEAQQVFANMMFNMGRTRLSKFKKMIAHAENSDFANAAIEGRDSNWYKQVTNRAERLMARLEAINVK